MAVFRINLGTNFGSKLPYNTESMETMSGFRSSFFPNQLLNNRKLRHGDEFTVGGYEALYLRENYTSGAFKFLDEVSQLSLATVTTAEASDITFSLGATLGGEVVSDGGSEVTVRGVCYSMEPNPTLDDEFTENGSGVGVFSEALSGLDYGTYYVRAYATNGVGTAYGNEIEFETQICLVGGTRIRTINGTKLIEDIGYGDELVVWDFDKGCLGVAKPLWIKRRDVSKRYNVLRFSDGSELRTVNKHRIFSVGDGAFMVPEIGMRSYGSNGEVELVEKRVVEGEVDYYNVISEYHMNLFSGGILTSCRWNNVYPIEGMRFVKDGRMVREVSGRFGYGMRMGEQDVDESYICRLIDTEV